MYNHSYVSYVVDNKSFSMFTHTKSSNASNDMLKTIIIFNYEGKL